MKINTHTPKKNRKVVEAMLDKHLIYPNVIGQAIDIVRVL